MAAVGSGLHTIGLHVHSGIHLLAVYNALLVAIYVQIC